MWSITFYGTRNAVSEKEEIFNTYTGTESPYLFLRPEIFNFYHLVAHQQVTKITEAHHQFLRICLIIIITVLYTIFS